jgi:hypothetical protein
MDEARFIDAVLSNPVNRAILSRLPELGLPDAWLVSGAVFQTVWNVLTGRPPQWGVKDYDVFYFDPDTSWEAEDAVIRRAVAAFADTGAATEPRNQARVHLWYTQKFGAPYPPLQRATDGIDRFLARVAQIGIRLVNSDYEIYAPHGLNELTELVVRPNLCTNFRAEIYEAKAASWKARWPEIAVVPANTGDQPTPTATEREAAARRWFEENKQAVDAYNKFVENGGLFSDGLRKF